LNKNIFKKHSGLINDDKVLTCLSTAFFVITPDICSSCGPACNHCSCDSDFTFRDVRSVCLYEIHLVKVMLVSNTCLYNWAIFKSTIMADWNSRHQSSIGDWTGHHLMLFISRVCCQIIDKRCHPLSPNDVQLIESVTSHWNEFQQQLDSAVQFVTVQTPLVAQNLHDLYEVLRNKKIEFCFGK